MDQEKVNAVKDEMKSRLEQLENIDAEELSEDELEEVAGGWCSWRRCSNAPEEDSTPEEQ